MRGRYQTTTSSVMDAGETCTIILRVVPTLELNLAEVIDTISIDTLLADDVVMVFSNSAFHRVGQQINGCGHRS